ncbi:DUF4123 domain-containing protein [Caballeronia sp. HLA56]
MENMIATPSAQDADMDWEQWRHRLLAQFDSFMHEQSVNLYLLVDTRGSPGIDKLFPKVKGLAWTSLWHGSVLDSYTDIAPYLIHVERLALDDPQELAGRLARRIWMEGASGFMLTWIWSPLSLTELDEHLKHYTRYAIPDKREYFLHFYDNRILARIRSVWTDEQAYCFIAPCREIWFRNRDQGEIVWRSDGASKPARADAPLLLSSDQHARLFALGHADKLAMQLREMYGVRLDEKSDFALYLLVTEQLERASRYRLREKDDFLNYVSKGIVLSPRFDEHPVIQERLQRARNGEISHREALSGLTPDVIKQVAES